MEGSSELSISGEPRDVQSVAIYIIYKGVGARGSNPQQLQPSTGRMLHAQKTKEGYQDYDNYLDALVEASTSLKI